MGLREYKQGCLFAAVTMLLTLAAACERKPSEYRLTDLGALTGDEASFATSLNDRGDVVGASGSSRAFVYHDGQLTLLEPPAGVVAISIFDINSGGVMVGDAVPAGGSGNVPLIIGGDLDWGNLGIANGIAYSINDTGQIAGGAAGPGPFRYADGNAISLGTDGGVAYGINEAGDVVGVSADNRAFLWSAGTLTDLGVVEGDNYSAVYAVNDRTEAVGSSGRTGIDDGQAVVFSRSSGIRPLGRLAPDDTFSVAFAINNCGDVVGLSGNNPDVYANEGLRAFLVTDGHMRDLNELIADDSGVTLTAATAINNAGQIAGRGVVGGKLHAVLLTPTTPRALCTADG